MTMSLDPQSLLMVRSSMSATIEGHTIRVDSRWDYPPHKRVARPEGVIVRDCM